MDEKTLVAGQQTWLDSLGVTISIACAIQCTIFPLLIGTLPLLGLSFLIDDGIEKIFLLTSISLAFGGFCWGFQYHKQFYIFLFLIAGLALILTGRVWVEGTLELPFVVFGTLLLASGHILNRRLCRLCHRCEKGEPVVKLNGHGSDN